MVLLIIALLAACSRDIPDTGRDSPTVDLEILPGVYAGVFPCANCPGIDWTLWLRSDGTFFLRQKYLDPEGAPTEAFYNLGRWRSQAEEPTLTLTGSGPERVFDISAAGRLVMQTAVQPEHVLLRKPGISHFGDSLTLKGEYLGGNNEPLFHECLTGLRLAIASTGDYRRIRHHFRSIPRGQPAFATLRGHLKRVETKTGTAELLVIDELIRLESGRRCTRNAETG